MSDPSTHAAIAAQAAGTGAGVVIGSFIGVDLYVVVTLSLLGAAVAQIYIPRLSFQQMCISILGSFVLGVVTARIVGIFGMAVAIHCWPWLETSLTAASKTEIVGLIAFLAAFLAQKAVPIFFNWLDSRGGIKS